MPRGPAIFRPIVFLLAAVACSGAVEAAGAQTRSIIVEAGIIEYDAGGDQTYPSFSLRGGKEILPWLRVGVGVSLGIIGDIPRGDAFEAGGSEDLWRFYGTATAVADQPFGNSGIAVLKGMSPEFGIGIGVAHSAGLEINPDIFDDPFNGIEDQPTGLALGASIGLRFPVSHSLSIRGTVAYWREQLYGGALDDFELTGGLQFNW